MPEDASYTAQSDANLFACPNIIAHGRSFFKGGLFLICRKCSAVLQDDWIACPYCSTPVKQKPRTRRRRANGEGNVYQPPGCKTYTARIVVAYVATPNGLRPKYARKGGFKTKRDALEYIPTLRAEAHQAEKDAPQIRHGVDYTQITFKELYDKLIAREEKRITKSTLDCYKAAYKYYADVYHLPFRELNTEDWQICVDDCPKGIRTKENMKALGTKLYKLAAELRVFGLSTSTDFATLVWLDREDKESRQPFALDDVSKLKAAVTNGVPYANYILAMCYTGFRPSEFLALKRDAYDPAKNTLRGGAKTDAGKNRIVPVHPLIKAFVAERYLSGSSYLFPDPQGLPFKLNVFRSKYFYRALSLANIQPEPQDNEKPRLTPYSCRHTFATSMKNIKGSPRDKAALMGHTSYEMTLHYQHEDYESLRDIVEQIS